MKIKRILMPLMALVIMAGQLTGCGNSGAKELQDKLSKGEEIVIEAEAKNGDVKGEPCEIGWIELAKKTSNANSRKAIDKYFSNYEIEGGSKIGSFYLNADCKQESNNTILTVLGNQFVADLLKNNGDIMGEISQYLNKDYADLETSDYLSAMFNAYFELIPDSEPNYFNGGVSLTRAEAMALVMRAVTPVENLKTNEAFEKVVKGSKYDEYIAYAAKEDSKVYISTADSSLSSDNFAGVMTRGEYIYLVINEVYGVEEVNSRDIESIKLKDCANGGDIGASLKFKGSDRIKAACLKYAIENVDKGAPQELYKAIAMANSLGVISSETRWEEGITKAEAIEILVGVMQAYYKEKGYLCNNAEGGSTAALETAAQALWKKQDINDMKCTEEEFIADYIKAISEGRTKESFESNIPGLYSIKYGEERAKKEEEAKKKAEEQKKKEEANKKEESSNNSSDNNYYEEPDYNYEEPDNSYQEPADNSYQEPVYQEPAYTPPADNDYTPDTGSQYADDLSDLGGAIDWDNVIDVVD